MIIKPPPKYPANCKKCKHAELTETGEQAYCHEKGIFKRVKYFSCKVFEPKEESCETERRHRITRKAAPELTEEERLAIQRYKLAKERRGRNRKRTKPKE